MPWSSGSFTRTDGTRTGSTVWQQAKAALVKILALDHDTHDQDLATGINNCLTKDGQNKPTANIDFDNKKIINMLAGTNSGDCLTVGQIGNGLTLTGGKVLVKAKDSTITISSSGISVSSSALDVFPFTTRGDLVYADASAKATRLEAGPIGSVLTSNGSAPYYDVYSKAFKNKIIGGNFATNRWTKGTSLALASSAGNSSFPDNWIASNQTDGAITVSRITGFCDQGNGRLSSYACKINVDTADTSIGAGQYVVFQQNIEANSITEAGFGVGGTRYINISYLLKSNVTGTLCMYFENAGYTRSYIKEVSVTGSDTVQLVNFSIPVDTTGTWNTTEGTVGLRMGMVLCSGSTYQTTPKAWTAGNYLATSNQTNFLAAQNNYIAFDLVQVECGNVATPFEYRDYATEEKLQDRYLPVIKPIGGLYSVIGSGQCTTTIKAHVFIPFKNKSYKTPTGLVASGANHFYLYNATGSIIQTSSCAFTIAGQDAAMVAMEVPSGLVAGNSTICIGADNAAGIYFTGAECA